MVAVVDFGINSIYLNDKVRERIYCPNGICWTNNGTIIGTPTYPIGLLNSTNATHGTQVAQVIAASGMSSNNGIAQGVTLLDALTVYYNATLSEHAYIIYRNGSASFAESLDWSVTHGADIASISIGPSGECNAYPASKTLNLILNEAVDQGVLVVSAAGNESFLTGFIGNLAFLNNRTYRTVGDPSCAYNIITVGGIDDRVDPISMYNHSSRGPANSTGPVNPDMPILKPEIVAPATEIVVLYNSTHLARATGTSVAAPQVSAVAALMLETNPNLTPTEVKTLLLLGANWTATIPCTSHQFEQNNTNDCSFARQPSDLNEANNSTSLSILNNVGFGILDAVKSLRYVQSSSHMISDHISTNSTKKYEFNVTNTTEPVKVILSWLVHPHGNIRDQIGSTTPAPFTNLDFVLECGQQKVHANSSHQINEFAVFVPSQTGKCVITVTSPLQNVTSSTQNYTLVSTYELGPFIPTQNIVNKTTPTGTTLTITLPEPTEHTDAVIGLMTYPDNRIKFNTQENTIGNGTRYYDEYISGDGIIIHHETEILDKTFTYTRDHYCYETIVLVGNLDTIPKNHTTALWLEFGRDSKPKRCDNAPDISFDGKLLLNKEVYVQFNDTEGQTPFYHISGTKSIVPIPKCTDTNFNSTHNTLKRGTEICYGKNGTDTIIVSKILAIFGVTDIKQITIHDSVPFHLTGTIDLHTAHNKIRIDTHYEDTGTIYHINDQADITIYRDTEIVGKKFTNDPIDVYCYVGDLLVNHTVQQTRTLEINFRQSSDQTRCDTAPVITFDDKLDLSKEIYVRFVGTHDHVPFYMNGTSNIAIPKCTDTNFDDTTNTLIGNTEICYGEDGDDTVLVSKILAVFGVMTKTPISSNGTIDSVMTIPPNDLPNNTLFMRIVFVPGDNGTIEIDGAEYNKKGKIIKNGTRFTDSHTYSIGDVYITRTDIINVDTSAFVHKDGIYCYTSVFTRVPQDRLDITIPLNESAAMGFQFAKDPNEKYPVGDVYYSCADIPDISFSGKILLDREIRVQLDDVVGRDPFYYVNGTDTVVPIPKCTAANFDNTTQTLKGNTSACYGKYDNNIIIITKMMNIFGTTTEKLVAPKVSSVPDLFNPNDPLQIVQDYTNATLSYQTFSITPRGQTADINVYGDKRFTNAPNALRLGDVYIQYRTKVMVGTDIFDINQGTSCVDVGFTHVIDMPYSATKGLSAMGFNFTNAPNMPLCTIDLASYNGTLVTDKEMYITLYQNATAQDISPYYSSPREGDSTTKSIPMCVSGTNLYNTQTLMTGADMCYGTYQNDIIIITKKFGVYGN